MKVNLVVSAAWTFMSSDDPKAIGIVDKYTSAFTSGYTWTAAYRSHRWDGKKHFLSKTRGRFPTGLVLIVQSALENAGYEVTVDYPQEEPDIVKEPSVIGIELRDYQLEAIQLGIERKRGIFNMATNAGKTEVMAGLISALDLPTLCVVHRKELKEQTFKRFESRLGNVDNIQVEMIQTLHARRTDKNTKHLLNETKVILVDECHHLPATTWYNLVQSSPAPYRFGFSGTPLRGRQEITDRDLALVAATGVPIYEVGNETLIREGVSSKPYVEFHVVSNPQMWSRMKFDKAYDIGIVQNGTRNRMILDHMKAEKLEGKKVLVLVQRIAHGETLSTNSGDSFIHGGTSSQERHEEFEKFKNGDRSALIASTILDEGIDVPDIDTLILAGAGKTPWALLQRIGRGMRWKEGGVLKVIEYLDNMDYPDGVLSRHAESRLKFLEEQEEFDVKVVGSRSKGLGRLL